MTDSTTGGGTRPGSSPGGCSCACAADVADLHVAVDELVILVADLVEADTTSNPRPWRWPDLTAEQATDAWTRLVTWVHGQLLGRHPHAAAVVAEPPACWYRHPDVVEELSALYVAWLAAYSRRPNPTAAAEWHDRWLPGAMTRIADVLKKCESEHVDPVVRERYGVQRDPAAEYAALLAHIEADARTRTTGELPPVVT